MVKRKSGRSHSNVGKTQYWLYGGGNSRDREKWFDSRSIVEEKASGFFEKLKYNVRKVTHPE